MSLTRKGFDLKFTHSLEARAASNASNYVFRRYFYSYHRGYGSPQREAESVSVVAARLSDDTMVSIELENLKPERVYELTLNPAVNSREGAKVVNSKVFYNAIHLR